MKNLFAIVFFFSLAACTADMPSRSAASQRITWKSACSFDRAALLAQDPVTFDQGANGLRSVYTAKPECSRAAADLIADYRIIHPKVVERFDSYLLYWHEGQLRAEVGEYDTALSLFEQARISSGVGPEFRQLWNLYVDATVAFLKHDRVALHAARTSLARVPPEVYRPAPSPPNLDVVDSLIRCFDRTYHEAYGVCRR